MAYYEDLQPCDYFHLGEDVNLIAVGWLENNHSFSTGQVPQKFYQKLSTLLVDPWAPVICMGPHECTLCQFEGAMGSNNLFLPYKSNIYVAPELILHYINCHCYCPPEVFIAGVMECPETRSMDYKKALLANGGRNLVKK